MSPMQWKVLPNGGNVVRLGFWRMQRQQQIEELKRKQKGERAQDTLNGQEADGEVERRHDSLRSFFQERKQRESASEPHTGLPNE